MKRSKSSIITRLAALTLDTIFVAILLVAQWTQVTNVRAVEPHGKKFSGLGPVINTASEELLLHLSKERGGAIGAAASRT